MKFLLNILPAICFFLTYKLTNSDLIYATVAIVLSSLVSFIGSFILYKSVSRFQIILLVVLLIFAVPTIVIKDESFIKLKVSVVNILIATGVLICQFCFKKDIVKVLSGVSTPIPDYVYRKATLMLAVFLVFGAILNYILAFKLPSFCELSSFCNFSEQDAKDIWVNYKTYGNGIINTIFFVFLVGWIQSKLTDEQKEELEKLLQEVKTNIKNK
ncbi:MAG: inner membrane-spanning protein YciB [Succinivibrionaceae bacterium]